MAKIIVVPKNSEAAHALDYNQAHPDQLVEWILTAEEFDQLWNDGVFSLLNAMANTLIDDFEYEYITDLEVLADIVKELKESGIQAPHIIELLELAIGYKTSIHFFF